MSKRPAGRGNQGGSKRKELSTKRSTPDRAAAGKSSKGAAVEVSSNRRSTTVAPSQPSVFSGHSLNSTPQKNSVPLVPETPPDLTSRPLTTEVVVDSKITLKAPAGSNSASDEKAFGSILIPNSPDAHHHQWHPWTWYAFV